MYLRKSLRVWSSVISSMKSCVSLFTVVTVILLLSGCGISANPSDSAKTTMSAYQKILARKSVSILVVGDSIAEGSGASDYKYAWPSILEEYIETKYKTKVNTTNISMGGESSLAGFVRLLELDPKPYYDLVMVCFGENDPEENFEIYYEALIRRILKQYPGCSIICIQEHSQRDYTAKMKTIKEIADHYGIPVVDTIQPFRDHPEGYDALVKDGTHPNDKGYEVFAEAVESVFDSEVDAKSLPIEAGTEPRNAEVSFFDNATWIPVKKFKKKSLTYTADIPSDIAGNGKKNFLSEGTGVMMVADLTDYPERNYLTVINNGELIAKRDADWPYSFPQHHIPIVSDNVIIREGTLTIEFENEEQAESFSGCGFILGE